MNGGPEGPWWAKTPTWLGLGIVGVPSLIAVVAVGALISNNQRQAAQVDIAQKQTADALDLSRKALDNAIQTQATSNTAINSIVGSFSLAVKDQTEQCRRAFRMSEFTCEVDAHDIKASQACKDFVRDLNQGLIAY